MYIEMTESELAHILAALRMTQNRTHRLEMLAMPQFDDSRLEPLNDEQTDDLCQRLNLGHSRIPEAVVEVSGGVAEAVKVDPGIQLTIRDHDNEAAGDECSEVVIDGPV